MLELLKVDIADLVIEDNFELYHRNNRGKMMELIPIYIDLQSKQYYDLY